MIGKRVGLLVVCVGIAVAAPSLGRAAVQQPLFAKQPDALKVSVVRTYPHDRNAFTQGLIWRDGMLYESTGLVGRSTLRKVDLATGAVKQQVPIPTPTLPRAWPMLATGSSS